MSQPTQAPAPRAPEDFITDWFLPQADPLSGFIYPGPVQIRDHPRLFDEAATMLRLAEEKTGDGRVEFNVRVGNRSFRGHKIQSISGITYAMRRLPDVVPSMDQLGVNPVIQQLLVHPRLSRGGLVLVCGETGAGKSTTCASAIKQRMESLGSFCLTLEDPPEMPLHGIHGNGRCIQTEVATGKWAQAMREAMRCYPSVPGSMMYVGETRDAETAAECLRISINGHLVLTTLHADGLEAAVRRFISLASAAMLAEEVRYIMASSFRLAVHQQLEPTRDRDGRMAKRLRASFLFSPNGRSPVAQKIIGGAKSLNNEIRTQEMLVAGKGAKAIQDLMEEG